MRRKALPLQYCVAPAAVLAIGQLVACSTGYTNPAWHTVHSRYAQATDTDAMRRNDAAMQHLDRAAEALQWAEARHNQALFVTTDDLRADVDLYVNIARREIEMAELFAQAERTRVSIAALKARKAALLTEPAQRRMRTVPVAGVAASNPTGPAPAAPLKLTLTDVSFDFNKAEVKEAFAGALAELAAALQSRHNVRLLVEGHTDSRGSEYFNRKLSEQRASAVKSYLIKQGVPAARIIVRAMGESKPLATNATEEGRAKNRRVELSVIDP